MLADKILQGDIRAASRLMRDIDDAMPSATGELRRLFQHTGRAQIVGITGSPGAGKSTLTDRLIAAYRKQGKRVGVVAVDPTSPFTGGAILGDRIRMQAHATDEGVFIRSLATRGNLGGVSLATSDVIRVMDAMGMDVVLVETVGVGQDEIEIARLAHTTIVVVVPGMGDDIQAIKAGILEIADVFAVNKSDREGADRTVRELRSIMDLRYATLPITPGEDPHAALEGMWETPIVKTVASRDTGVDKLVEAIDGHHQHLITTGELQTREAARARNEFLGLLRARLLEGALKTLAGVGTLDEVAGRIARREQDPYELAEELVVQLQPGPERT